MGLDIGSAFGIGSAGSVGVGTALSLGSSVLGYKGVKDTNQANRDIATARNLMEVQEAQKARDFSGGQAQKAMDFSERMSSTAIQRRMKDMKTGGINPILAGKFDASSPAGQVGATAKANAHGYESKNKIAGGLDRLSTALDLKAKIANIKNIEANTNLTNTKQDISDPIRSMMEILQSTIDTFTGSAKDRQIMGTTVKNKLIDAMEAYKEGKRIESTPGIELTPGAKQHKKRLMHDKHKIPTKWRN